MTGNAIKAKSEAPELHELSSEELDAVSGGFIVKGGLEGVCSKDEGGQKDPAAQLFQHLLQQLTQGQG
jgi:hypothetical protein